MQSPTKVVGRRVVAFLIDLIIYLVVVVGAWFALTTEVPGKCPSSGGGIDIGDNCRGFLVSESGKQTAWYLIILALLIVLWGILPGIKGTSPGHAALGIRIVNGEGQPPGLLRGLVRGFFLWLIDVSIVGLIVAAVTQRNQRVGDLVAGTYVIDKNAVGGAIAAEQPPAFASGGGQYGPPPTGAPAAASPPQEGSQPADWYPDPQGQARLRYWDGQRWTEHTSA